MAAQQRLEMLIPFVHEIKPAFLYPAVKIASRDLIWIMKHSIFGSQNLDRSFFHRNPRPAQSRWVWSEVSTIKISHAGVVLHDQRSAGCDEIEQPLVICRHIFLRVVSANSQHNRSVHV